MSRIGNRPIPVPKNVTVEIEGQTVRVKGPRGSLEQSFRPDVSIEQQDGHIIVGRPVDSKTVRALQGLTRTLINNMVVGVTAGFRRDLEISGVGYRAAQEGKTLVLSVGYSHQVRMQPPEGITYVVETPTRISVQGIDKQLVGEQAAKIRQVRKPEPYKGKGIRYSDEIVRRKAGKAGKTGGRK